MKNLKFDIITFDAQTDHHRFVVQFFHALNRGGHIVLCTPNQVDYVAGELNKIKSNKNEDEFLGKQYICFLTSGSSGAPKLIFHSYKTLNESVESFIEFFKLTSGNPSYISLPLNHVGGFLQFLRAQTLDSPLSFSHDYISMISTIEDGGVFSFVPAQMLELEKKGLIENLSKAKLVLLGGQAPDINLLKRWNKIIPNLAISYGLTESAAILAGDYIQNLKIKEEKIFASILPRRQVSLNENGIYLKGHGICHGILKEGRLTSMEGIQTSDLGIIEEGRLAITGRSDLMFISGGENIDPVRIENEVATSLGIKSVVIPTSHLKFGNAPALIIDERDLNKIENFQSFKDKLKRLESYEVPKLIFPISNFSSGKPNRAALKKEVTQTNKKLLTLHGFFGNGEDFKTLFENHPLKENIHHYDIPGIANQDIPKSKDELFENLNSIIKEKSITHYLGYSLGGRLLIEGILEKKIPNLPIMIIASNPGIDEEQRAARLNWESKVRDDLNSMEAKEFLSQWYDLGLFTGLKNHQDFDLLLKKRVSSFHSKLAESFDFYSIVKTKNYWNELSKLKGYYLTGNNDQKYCDFGERIENDSDINLVHKKIPESSHYCHWQNPQEFFFLFNQFFLK